MASTKTSFALDESTEAFIRAQVAQGHFTSGSHVVREALRRMQASTAKEAALLARLDRALAEENLDMTHDEVWEEALRP